MLPTLPRGALKAASLLSSASTCTRRNLIVVPLESPPFFWRKCGALSNSRGADCESMVPKNYAENDGVPAELAICGLATFPLTRDSDRLTRLSMVGRPW